jgi:hypothetical protein
MHRNHVIATCCYCGSRAALSLGGTATRHELACAACGAPLARMKNLPVDAGRADRPVAGKIGTARNKPRKMAGPEKKRKRRRSLTARILDIAEDLVDEVFD